MQRDFAQLVNQNSSECIFDILNNSDEETRATAMIKQARWPVGQTFTAFEMNQCLVKQQDVEDKIVAKYARQESIWSIFGKHFDRCIRQSNVEDELQTHLITVK